MSIQIKEEMNSLPVKAYKWLKLNHLKLGEDIGKSIKPYNKKSLKEVNDKNILIGNINNVISLNQYMDKLNEQESEYGVSKELVELAENFHNTGVFAHVPRNVTIEEPIRIEYVLDDDNDVVIDNNVIIASENSKITVVIDYSTAEDIDAFHNGAMKIYAKEGSNVDIIKIQRMNDKSYHFDSNLAIIEYGANVNYVQVEFGSKKSVTNYISNLKDESKSSIDSIYLGDKDRRIDLNYYMNHVGRKSISNIQTRGALKDRAKKAFKGTIDFKLGSSKSEGSEEEYVILFDKDVKSQAVPLLLCTEDDVKGQHAASAGKVDEEKLFYMMSRGFDKEEAMKIIVEASFNPIIDKVPLDELKTIVREEIHHRLVTEGNR